MVLQNRLLENSVRSTTHENDMKVYISSETTTNQIVKSHILTEKVLTDFTQDNQLVSKKYVDSKKFIYSYCVTSSIGTPMNSSGMTCSQSGTTFSYTFSTTVTSVHYGISVQHFSIPSGGLPSGNSNYNDLNSFITNKTTSGFNLIFGFGDNSNVADVLFNVDHSVMVYGL